MKGIYLAAYKAEHKGHDIVYQDINGKRDIGGDMMDVDLSSYDYIIASPPCNYWSIANYRREISSYSQKTKHLLPGILDKLIEIGKPFIVENVRNEPMFLKAGLMNKPVFVYQIGRHIYWTNVFLNHQCIDQTFDNIKHIATTKRQGGINVHNVIEEFLDTIGA